MNIAMNRRATTVRKSAPAVVHRAQVRAHRSDDRRGSTPLAGLARAHNDLCVTAVDPWQIAAGLEAEGMNDRTCHQYGYADVFSLAEALFMRVPRRGASVPSKSQRSFDTTARSVRRGVIYALPGLAGITALRTVGADSVWVILVCLGFGWGWSQAMSFLGHRNLGWFGPSAANAVLRSWLLVGLAVLGTLIIWITLSTGISGETAVVGAGVGIYQLAAGALLVLGDDIVLLAVLLPAGLAVVLLALDLAPYGTATASFVTALTVLVVLVLAVRATGRRETARHAVVGRKPGLASPRKRARGNWLRAEDVRAGAPHFAYGIACAAAVGVAPLTWTAVLGQRLSSAWYLALPLVMSMGAAEWQLQRLRKETDLLLRTETQADEFARRVRRAMFTALMSYAGMVLLLVAVISGLTSPASGGRTVTVVSGYGVLALCFFVCLVLLSVGEVLFPVACLAVGLSIYLGWTALDSASVARNYLVSLLVCLAVLCGFALTRLRSPLVHI